MRVGYRGEDVTGSSTSVERFGEPALEAGQHILAIEEVVRTEPPNVGQGPVDGGGAPLGVDHPHEPHARLEILTDLVENVAGPVVGGKDLDGQVGRDVGESLRDLLASKAALRYEGHVGQADIAPRQPEARARVEHVPEPPLRAEGMNLRAEVHGDQSVPAPRRAHAKLPVDELVLPPVPRRAEQVLFGGQWPHRRRHSRAPREEKSSTDIHADRSFGRGHMRSVCLPEAVRRLAIPATVIEVMRREGSAVELRTAKDPVSRYIEDAMALALTDGLPVEAARCVVPGLCREALEAACMESVRRRRLGKGESHADVEALLLKAHKLTNLAALALFDDPARGGDVLPRIN
jgi:hypothetical protein